MGPSGAGRAARRRHVGSAQLLMFATRRVTHHVTHRKKETGMATLVAIGYPDQTTATAAAEEAQRLAADLIIEPEAIAGITRSKDGKFHVTTNHHSVGGSTNWGMFWG